MLPFDNTNFGNVTFCNNKLKNNNSNLYFGDVINKYKIPQSIFIISIKKKLQNYIHQT